MAVGFESVLMKPGEAAKVLGLKCTRTLANWAAIGKKGLTAIRSCRQDVFGHSRFGHRRYWVPRAAAIYPIPEPRKTEDSNSLQTLTVKEVEPKRNFSDQVFQVVCQITALGEESSDEFWEIAANVEIGKFSVGEFVQLLVDLTASGYGLKIPKEYRKSFVSWCRGFAALIKSARYGKTRLAIELEKLLTLEPERKLGFG